MALVGRQAEAAIPAGDRDFTGYIANVLFDDWDEVWADAPAPGRRPARSAGGSGAGCEPVWGLRLPPTDFAHNDLNLSNILTDGERITGVVDWDEFALGSRALDLVVLADRLRGSRRPRRSRPAADGGHRGRRHAACVAWSSYRALAALAEDLREDVEPQADIQAISAILDRLT